LFCVDFTNYAKSHFLKKFEKNYKGNQWHYTKDSILQDLSRLGLVNNKTQQSSQIDELRYYNQQWLAKYDFRIAGSKHSTKDSGNRAIIYVDNPNRLIKILLIYNKTDLPKNKNETDYIFATIQKEYLDIYTQFK